MHGDIILAMKDLIEALGERQALAEVLDSIETALGPDSPNGQAILELRDKFRESE